MRPEEKEAAQERTLEALQRRVELARAINDHKGVKLAYLAAERIGR